MWQALWGLDAELVDNSVYELSVCCRMTIYHKWSLKTSIIDTCLKHPPPPYPLK